MGFWDAESDYYISDVGVPFVKKTDSSTLGYSVYALIVQQATKGSWIMSEWRLLESAEFIYMQEAYIEKLQAQLISAVTVELKEDSSSDVTAGFSGIQGPDKDKPVFWSGGSYQDAINGVAKSIDRHDGSGIRAGGNIKWEKDGAVEFLAGIKTPFVDSSNVDIANFWESEITSWANNFYHYNPFASLPTRIIPCRPILNGQLFRIHSVRGNVILSPEENYGFQENGNLLNSIQLNQGNAIEMICICIDGIFHSWDIIKRYSCRTYNQ